jgi:anaerobic magnesium-protoporphyrin IX monomethyl ester cyclase
MKIAMLEARSSIKSVFDYTNQPLMAGPLLGQIMVEKGHHVECFAPQLAPIDWDYIKEMDIVGITALTLTAENAYELTRKCKNLGKIVVMGGPHVSFLPEEALDMGVDFVARREGHETFPEMIEAIEQGVTDFSHILGLSWKNADGKHIHNPDRPFCDQSVFEKLPIPDIKLIHGYGKLTSVPVLTQWGCPDNCEFCSVIQMCGRKIKHRAVESILTELKQLIGIYGPSVSIFFCADNFFAQQSQAEELLRGIIDRKLVVEGGLQMRIDTVCNKKLEVDDELLSLMYEAGIKMVYLGLESPNQETLDSYGKRLTIRQIEVGVRALAKKKFHTHGMFVLGGDTDDKTVFKKLVKFARRIKVHTVQFINLMPLPGTPLYYRYEREGRILTKDWNKYNGQFAVTKPRLMSAHELQVGTMRAVAKFYSRPWTAWLIFLSLYQILWLLIRYHRLRLNVAKACIALLTKKKDILQIITDRLSPHVQARIIHSIRLPFIRLWAHNQVKMVKAQVRGHTKLLRAC